VRDWIAVDRLTMADILAFVGLDFGRMIKFALPPELTNSAEVARHTNANNSVYSIKS